MQDDKLHNVDFWKETKKKSEEKLEKMFLDNGIAMRCIFIDPKKSGIEDEKDLEFVVSFVLDHATSQDEKATAVSAMCGWIQSVSMIKALNNDTLPKE